jgi:hypothetical protein
VISSFERLKWHQKGIKPERKSYRCCDVKISLSCSKYSEGRFMPENSIPYMSFPYRLTNAQNKRETGDLAIVGMHGRCVGNQLGTPGLRVAIVLELQS